MTWLARAGFETSWAHLPTTEFSAFAGSAGALAVMVVHGFADHGLGLPLDAEEVLAGLLLPEACARLGGGVLVLPPLRFGAAPYAGHTWFGVGLETAHALVMEQARSVKFAGFERLLIFSTSPWQRELLDAAARDARVETGMRVYRVHVSALGFDFHPAGGEAARSAAQALVAGALGVVPVAMAGAEGQDLDFRPGRWAAPAGLRKVMAREEAERLRILAVERLAVCLREAGAGGAAGSELVTPTQAGLWRPWGKRYLGACLGGELQVAGRGRGGLVIIPTGAIEQHGPHLPVGVDAMIGQGLLARALADLPDGAPVWVAPPVIVGKSNEHADWPGTLSHSASTFWALARALVEGLAELGFRRIAFFNTHGGNSALLVPLIRELQSRMPELRVGMLQSAFRPVQTAQEAAFGFHAGQWETALMLALAPALVKRDLAMCHYPARLDDPGLLRPEGAALTFGWTTRDIAPQGVMGDARSATPELGEEWCARAAESLAEAIERLVLD